MFGDNHSSYFMYEYMILALCFVGVLGWNIEVERFIIPLLRNVTMPCQETQFHHISSRSRKCSITSSGSEKYYASHKISARIECRYTIGIRCIHITISARYSVNTLSF